MAPAETRSVDVPLVYFHSHELACLSVRHQCHMCLIMSHVPSRRAVRTARVTSIRDYPSQTQCCHVHTR